MEERRESDPDPPPKVVSAEATGDSVVVAFDDGSKCAYSAETLYALMPMEFELAKSGLERNGRTAIDGAHSIIRDKRGVTGAQLIR